MKVLLIIACVLLYAVVIFLALPRVLERYTVQDYGWLSQFFDAVYVVCLPERRAYAEEVMQDLEVKPLYIEAVQAIGLSHSKLVEAGLVTKSCQLALSEIARALSHNNALRTFLDTPNAKTAIVFEDDVEFLGPAILAEVKEAMFDTLDNVPPDWDVINFGRCLDECALDEHVGRGVLKSHRALCRHAYAVSRPGAQKLISATSPLSGTAQSDVTIAQQRHINVYVPTRVLFRLKSGPPECS
jgi:hypothetical protein